MNKFLAIVMAIGLGICDCSVKAQAAIRYWHLGAQIGADDTDWNDPDNWGELGTNGSGVPGAADHVILNNYAPLTDPLITGSAAPVVNILTPSWHNGVTSTLNIGPGGSINTNGAGNGFARLSGGNNATSTVNFLPGAGTSVWNILQMSFNNAAAGMPVVGTESDSFINLDGGTLHLGSLGFSNNGLNTTNIDIGKDGQLLVNGDQTDAGTGNATSWINSGFLTALDATSGLDVSFDAPNNRTVFTVQNAPLGTTPANAEVLNFVWRLHPTVNDSMSSSIPSEYDAFSGDGQIYYGPQDDGGGYLSLYRNFKAAAPQDHLSSNSQSEGSGSGYSPDGRVSYLYPDGSQPGTVQIGRARNPVTGDHALVRPGETLPGYGPEALSGYAFPRYGNQGSELLELTGGGVTIGSNLAAGGSLWEWTHNGKQFINSRDFGRQIQSAYFDPTYGDSEGLFGLINPTEAGSRFSDLAADPARRQGSPLISAQNNGLTQSTRSVPLEWSPENFGGGPDNPVLWKEMVLGKEITLDYNGMGPVAKYETILVPPTDSVNSQFELPTGYLTAEFNRFYTYEATSQDLNEVDPVPLSNMPVSFVPSSGFGGVIIADASGSYAMGIYGVLRSSGGSVDYFTLWDFINGAPDIDATDTDTTKFSAVFGPGSVTGGLEYHFTTWIMSGSLAEVTGHMDALKASGELGAITIANEGPAGDFDSDGDIDGADFLTWQRDLASTPTGATDFADWEAGFGTTPGAFSAASSAVPEPSSLVLLVLAVGGCSLKFRATNFWK